MNDMRFCEFDKCILLLSYKIYNTMKVQLRLVLDWIYNEKVKYKHYSTELENFKSLGVEFEIYESSKSWWQFCDEEC